MEVALVDKRLIVNRALDALADAIEAYDLTTDFYAKIEPDKQWRERRGAFADRWRAALDAAREVAK